MDRRTFALTLPAAALLAGCKHPQTTLVAPPPSQPVPCRNDVKHDVDFIMAWRDMAASIRTMGALIGMVGDKVNEGQVKQLQSGVGELIATYQEVSRLLQLDPWEIYAAQPAAGSNRSNQLPPGWSTAPPTK